MKNKIEEELSPLFVNLTCIASDKIEDVLKNNHIFNNIVLTSKSCIINVSPKSDMAII